MKLSFRALSFFYSFKKYECSYQNKAVVNTKRMNVALKSCISHEMHLIYSDQTKLKNYANERIQLIDK